MTHFYRRVFPRLIILSRRIIVILFFILSGHSDFAQQYSLLTQYMFNNMAINPGYAGSSEGISATFLFRNQWIGYKSDTLSTLPPKTYVVTIDSPLKFLHGAVDLSFYQDNITRIGTTNVNLGYTYKADLGNGSLGAGVQIEFVNVKIDLTGSNWNPVDPDDPVLLDGSKANDFILDLALGLFYKVPDKYFLGLSANNILQTKGTQTHYQLRRQYYLTGGYYYVLPRHPEFELQPSALLQFDGAVFQFNLSGLVEYNNKFWGGIEYRFQDAVCVLLGGNVSIPEIGIFKVGVSYDIATSSMSKYSWGGVEVMLNYCFKIKTEKFRKSYKNTRFL